MADRAAIAVQVVDRFTAVEPTQTDAIVADYHMFLNDGRTFLFLIGGAANCEITVQTPGTVDGLAIDDIIFDIPSGATEYRIMGPFPPSVWNNAGAAAADNGTVHIDIDDDTTLTLEAFRLPA